MGPEQHFVYGLLQYIYKKRVETTNHKGYKLGAREGIGGLMKTFIREIPANKLSVEDVRKMERVGFTLVIKFDSVEVWANTEPMEMPTASEKAA
jgi:hypothetical protein